MAPPRRAPANSNVIKLNLDPMTFDALKAEAGLRRDTMERTAYAILQQGLAHAAAIAAATPKQPADELPEYDVSRFTSLDNLRNPTNR